MTQRELEIFTMLAKGTPARVIAEQLCISAKTVSNHLTLLKSKLQVSSHAELVHLGIDLGVVRWRADHRLVPVGASLLAQNVNENTGV
jgi:DNA-binding NarL/FixJ family response regulator